MSTQLRAYYAARAAEYERVYDRPERRADVARLREIVPSVDFRIADAFNPATIPGEFDAAFAGFWWSHVPRGDLPGFVRGLNGRLRTGAVVMLRSCIEANRGKAIEVTELQYYWYVTYTTS